MVCSIILMYVHICVLCGQRTIMSPQIIVEPTQLYITYYAHTHALRHNIKRKMFNYEFQLRLIKGAGELGKCCHNLDKCDARLTGSSPNKCAIYLAEHVCAVI